MVWTKIIPRGCAPLLYFLLETGYQTPYIHVHSGSFSLSRGLNLKKTPSSVNEIYAINSLYEAS